MTLIIIQHHDIVTQYNDDTKYNDAFHNDIQHNLCKHNGAQHNDNLQSNT